jgi:hypothetical protein
MPNPNKRKDMLHKNPSMSLESIVEDLRSYFDSAAGADAKNAKNASAKDDKNTLAKDANNALAKLEKLGCDSAVILQRLYLYAGKESNAMKWLRKQNSFGNSRRRMLDLAQDFENVPEKIQQADKLLRQVGVYCNFVPNVSALTDYVRLLKTASSFFQASLKRNSERNRHLVFVELYVRHKTRKHHYPELAAIVSGIRLWCGLARDVDVDAEAIRGKVNRFAPAIIGMMGEVSEPPESGESTTDEDIKVD